jgi:hypothetical protein
LVNHDHSLRSLRATVIDDRPVDAGTWTTIRPATARDSFGRLKHCDSRPSEAVVSRPSVSSSFLPLQR